jgi:hypothetical protein
MDSAKSAITNSENSKIINRTNILVAQREKLTRKLDRINEEMMNLQKICEHPNGLCHRWRDPIEVRVYLECKCPDCGKVWTERLRKGDAGYADNIGTEFGIEQYYKPINREGN